MLELIYEILLFIYNGIVELFEIIINFPSFLNKITTYYKYVNLTNTSFIGSIIGVIIAVCVAIRIKRLIV